MELFKIKNLTYSYPDTEQPALQIEALSIDAGQFILAIGGSGSGKSSLARVLAGLLPGFFGGVFGGNVYYRDRLLDPLQTGQLAGTIGMVFQDPEKQMVMSTVEAEIAFGLENMGLPHAEMQRRTAEVMSFLGLTPFRFEFTANLSGGQKQRLALASVLAMQPEVLILDEPTSQLDPLAAEEILNLCKRINEEMGITVILVEQRLDRCFHLADRIIYLEKGAVLYDAAPADFANWAVARQIPFVPPVSRLSMALTSVPDTAQLGYVGKVPVTIKEARQLLQSVFLPQHLAEQHSAALHTSVKQPAEHTSARLSGLLTSVMELHNVWYTYPKGREALKGINLRLADGEFFTVMGENGAGKSTLLRVIAGIVKPSRGQAILLGDNRANLNAGDPRIGYLSQNPNDYLFHDTVQAEVASTLQNYKLPDAGRVDMLLEQLGLGELRDMNPRDLSGGERQRVALASVLIAQPRLLILDEPTRGMDYRLKRQLGELLLRIAETGCTLLMVTHDVEFAAEYATRAAVMFDGQIVSEGSPHEVFGSSLFYSTQTAKVFRGYADGILTPEMASAWLKSILPDNRGRME